MSDVHYVSHMTSHHTAGLTTTPTHVSFPCTSGETGHGVVLEVRADGYLVSAFGGQRMFVPFNLVNY